MKRTIFAALVLAVSLGASFAHAGNNNGPDFGGSSSAAAQSNASAAAQSNASAAAVGVGVSHASIDSRQVTTVGPSTSSAQGGTALSTGGSASAASGASTSSVAVVNPAPAQKIQIDQAPTVYAPTALPTAPCRVAYSGGLSVPFAGLSMGGSAEDEHCTRREDARALSALGMKEAAVALMCQSAKVAAAVAAAGGRCPQ
jgi:hypothetical protein